MANNNNRNTLNVPNLRFPEFEGEWEKSLLGEIATISKGIGISKDQLSETGQSCILYGELYTKYKSEIIQKVLSRTNIDSMNLVKSKANDVIIPSSGETAIDIATARCVPFSDILLGGDLNIIRLKHGDGSFLSYQLNGVRQCDIARVAQGISVVHLYGESIKKLNIAICSYKEQNKIASFLSLLDCCIETQIKIIEELKLLKSTLGKLFFVETIFDLYVNLGDLCNITTGKLDANAMTENGEYPFFTCAKDIFQINDYAFDTEALLISGNGANVGYIHYYNGKFNAYQRTYVLNNFNCNIHYVNFFLQLMLPKQIEREKSIGNTPYIVRGTLADMKIGLPPNNSQEKIVQILSAIDMKINTEELLLKNYTKQKQYFLHEMFI